MAADYEADLRARVLAVIDRLVYEENLPVGEIAGKLHTSGARIAEWRRGKGLPTVQTLMALCGEYFISGNYLLSGHDENGMSNISAHMQSLIKRVEALEKAGKKDGNNLLKIPGAQGERRKNRV